MEIDLNVHNKLSIVLIVIPQSSELFCWKFSAFGCSSFMDCVKIWLTIAWTLQVMMARWESGTTILDI